MATITAILAQLGDTRRKLQYKELRQLNDIGDEAQEEFLAAWRRIEAERRVEIAGALAALAEEDVELDFRAIFRAILEDKEPDVRVAAVDGLWEDDRLSTLRRLLPMLQMDPNDDVRASVALALGRFAYRASIEELSARVGRDIQAVLMSSATNFDLDDAVRRRVIEGLGYFEGEDVLQVIGQAYTSGRQPLKESALVAMGRTLDERWLPVFDLELQNPVAALRYEAARASGEFGRQASSLLPRLLPLTESDDSEVAQAAIWALGQIGGESARRSLRRLAGSEDPAIQQAAEEALAELDLDDPSLALL